MLFTPPTDGKNSRGRPHNIYVKLTQVIIGAIIDEMKENAMSKNGWRGVVGADLLSWSVNSWLGKVWRGTETVKKKRETFNNLKLMHVEEKKKWRMQFQKFQNIQNKFMEVS